MKVHHKTTVTSKSGRLPIADRKSRVILQPIRDCIEVRMDTPGETDVTATGHLSDDLQYCLKTFTLIGHGETLFMLAAEVARITGYRDSYLLFLRNRSLRKIITNRAERDDLLQRGVIPFSYRYRHISVVTARSVFIQFGHRVIVDNQMIQQEPKNQQEPQNKVISTKETPSTPVEVQPETTTMITASEPQSPEIPTTYNHVVESHVRDIPPWNPITTYPAAASEMSIEKSIPYNHPVESSPAIDTIRQDVPREPLKLPSIRDIFGSPQGPPTSSFRWTRELHPVWRS